MNEVVISGIGLVIPDGVSIENPGYGHTTPETVQDPMLPDATPYQGIGLPDLDLETYIPKKADRKAMTAQFLAGCYAAGAALLDANVDEHSLSKCAIFAASDFPDRDPRAEAKVFEHFQQSFDSETEELLINQLLGGLRPTAFLSRIPNLLAANISIVHALTGSSRTFVGGVLGGTAALEQACAEILRGDSDILVTGGSIVGTRFELLRKIYAQKQAGGSELDPLWQRSNQMVVGSAAVFLVLESKEHADKRGASSLATLKPHARFRTTRENHAAQLQNHLEQLTGPQPVMCNYSGAFWSALERNVWEKIAKERSVISSASFFGSCMEVDVFVQVALATRGLLGASEFVDTDGLGSEHLHTWRQTHSALIASTGPTGSGSIFSVTKL